MQECHSMCTMVKFEVHVVMIVKACEKNPVVILCYRGAWYRKACVGALAHGVVSERGVSPSVSRFLCSGNWILLRLALWV